MRSYLVMYWNNALEVGGQLQVRAENAQKAADQLMVLPEIEVKAVYEVRNCRDEWQVRT